MAFAVEQREKIIEESTARLLGRARNSRSLRVEDLRERIAASVEKYVLRDTPDASQSQIRDFCEVLNADDLCLIAACERGDAAAWGDLFETQSGAVRSAARSVTSNPDAAEDLAQSIWAELHGLKLNSSDKPAGKLGYYSGRGSLAGWLRAVVSQLAIDVHRKQSRLVQVEESREFENLAHESSKNDKNLVLRQAKENPEQAFDDNETSGAVETALQTAVRELDAEDRLLVKLYYFDGLKLKAAGAALGFHEATASRRLTKIHAELRKRVEKTLQTEKGWTREETARVLPEIAEKLSTNLESLISSEKSVQENSG